MLPTAQTVPGTIVTSVQVASAYTVDSDDEKLVTINFPITEDNVSRKYTIYIEQNVSAKVSWIYTFIVRKMLNCQATLVHFGSLMTIPLEDGQLLD